MPTNTLRSARSRVIAAVLALGGLGLAAPALAAPPGPDIALAGDHGGIVAVRHGGHHGFGRGRGHYHGFGRGRGHHYGWRDRGFGHRHRF